MPAGRADTVTPSRRRRQRRGEFRMTRAARTTFHNRQLPASAARTRPTRDAIVPAIPKLVRSLRGRLAKRRMSPSWRRGKENRDFAQWKFWQTKLEAVVHSRQQRKMAVRPNRETVQSAKAKYCCWVAAKTHGRGQ